MSLSEKNQTLEALRVRIQACIEPYAGRVEYGNLRCRVCDWDCGDGNPVTNFALVYETPGGSTDQINISYHHDNERFSLVDADLGEVVTDSLDEVLEHVQGRVITIPTKRLETLYGDIRRQIDAGSTHVGLVGHLNRMMNSELSGGTITHLEMRQAVTYAVQYMKSRS